MNTKVICYLLFLTATSLVNAKYVYFYAGSDRNSSADEITVEQLRKGEKTSTRWNIVC